MINEIERKIDKSRYSFVEKPESDGVVSGIQLNDTEYLGFIYAYTGDVKIGDTENPDGTRDILFDYDVLSVGAGQVTEETLDSVEFKSLLGNILIDIISEQLESAPDTIVFKGQ